MTTEFKPFPKIPRYRREVCLTEKIDGTNAAVVWAPVQYGQTKESELEFSRHPDALLFGRLYDQHGTDLGIYELFAQSRARFIKPGADNYGFAAWVLANADGLARLGPGAHYGEWWGSGIQRGYGRAPGDKRFSLFNVSRWDNESRPECCGVVPLLGWCKPAEIESYVTSLRLNGSVVAPGFMNPEGVVVYHSQSKQMYKILLEGDDAPKGNKENG